MPFILDLVCSVLFLKMEASYRLEVVMYIFISDFYSNKAFLFNTVS